MGMSLEECEGRYELPRLTKKGSREGEPLWSYKPRYFAWNP